LNYCAHDYSPLDCAGLGCISDAGQMWFAFVFGGFDGGRQGEGNGRRLATGNLDSAAQQR
jgi:hypothetical protein